MQIKRVKCDSIFLGSFFSFSRKNFIFTVRARQTAFFFTPASNFYKFAYVWNSIVSAMFSIASFFMSVRFRSVRNYSSSSITTGVINPFCRFKICKQQYIIHLMLLNQLSFTFFLFYQPRIDSMKVMVFELCCFSDIFASCKIDIVQPKVITQNSKSPAIQHKKLLQYWAEAKLRDLAAVENKFIQC